MLQVARYNSTLHLPILREAMEAEPRVPAEVVQIHPDNQVTEVMVGARGASHEGHLAARVVQVQLQELPTAVVEVVLDMLEAAVEAAELQGVQEVLTALLLTA